jgi:DNA-binding MarR family transcriptional regulator
VSVVNADLATAQRLRLALVRITRSLRRFDGNLSQSQLAALATIADRGPLRLSEVAHYEHVAASVATRVVASLEELGLVSRTSDPADKRASLMSITRKGRDMVADLRNERTRILEERLGQLTLDERRAIEQALDALEKLGRSES